MAADAARGAFATFVDGLTSPSPRALAASLLLAVVMLGGLEWALARGALWRLPVGWVLATPVDDWSHASWLAGRLSARDSNTPLVVLIGGSAAREAVAGNASVSAALSERSDTRVEFFNMGTRNQSLAEALLLTEQLPSVERGLVLYSVHPMFLRDGPEEWSEAAAGIRFPFRSEALAADLAEMAPEIEMASRFNVLRFRPQIANWVSRRLLQNKLFKPLVYVDHLYEGRGPMSNQALSQKLTWVNQRLPDYQRHRDSNLSLLRRAVALAKSKGYDVAIVSLPRNPIAERLVFQPVLADYQASIDTLAEELGVVHLDLHAELGFRRADFYDHIHFVSGSRPRFQRRFVEHVVRLGGLG